MKKIALIVLLLSAGLAVSAKQKSKKKTKSTNDITSVAMHRTVCFGRCPDYTIEITSAGMVTYTGIRFVQDSGIYKKNIGSKKAMEIINQFKTDRVDTCQDNYANRIPDIPGLILTIKYKNKTKVIHNAHFGPQLLKDLANGMDDVGKTHDTGWKKK